MAAVVRTLGILATSVVAAFPIFAAGVAIVSTELADNGDGDGFADTNETVQLRLVLRNTTSLDLHDVVLRLSTGSPLVACIGRPLIVVGDLAAGATRRTDDAFVFTLGPVDRQALGLGALSNLPVRLDVGLSSDHLIGSTVPAAVTLDLDLDVTGGSGPTAFFEGFESGTFGAFEPHNMDATLHSWNASDGYRCQYHNPDLYLVNTDCFLGASQAQADAFFWQVHTPAAGDGGKAYSGNNSLYMGIFGPTPDSHTTPLAVLEAMRSSSPINLGYHGPVPELILKQQVDFLDSRNVNAPEGEGPDRGIVALQLADANGQPVGDWIKLQPYLNVYDTLGVDNYSNCTFDPIDDGNDEDDYFDPTDPYRRYGPSSTCKPELSFAYIGETFAPFDAAKVGHSDGPGLQGSLGTGTWVESRFSLERFRGRRARLRFLNTSLRVWTFETWAQAFTTINPGPGDDGWWIDDVSVTGALTEPATVSVDTAANGSLPGLGDSDGDGAIDSCDTCPLQGDPSQADTDGDGVGDACDNCPGMSDPDRTDSDLDGLGDPCDACPFGDSADAEGDGVACAADNCRAAPNPGQGDLDGDGLGDACDACPFDARDDQDGDGLCGDVDDCAVLYDPEQSGLSRLSGPLYESGAVEWFAISPDDRTVVYTAHLPIGGPASGLFAVRPGEDAPVTTIDDLSDGRSIGSVTFTPDGTRVVYEVADALYSAPLDGGPPVLLVQAPYDQLDAFAIAPSGTRVVYAQSRELYSVPITGGVSTKLSTQAVNLEAGFVISHDSTRVFYTDSYEPYSVPLAGGTPTDLNGPARVEPILSIRLARDDSRLVYDAIPYGAQVLYSVPAGGGTQVTLGSSNELDYRISPDAATVVYWTGGDLFAVPIGGGTAVPLASQQRILSAEFGPDSAHVVFLGYEGAPYVYELYGVARGGGTPQKLNGPLAAEGAVTDFALSPDGSTVVYRADELADEVYELFSAPVAGGTSVRLNAPLVTGGDVIFPPVFKNDGSELLYHADQEADERVEVYRVTTAGGPVQKVNAPLVGGGDVTAGLGGLSAFFRDESAVVYRADQLADNKHEIFGVEQVPGAGGDGGLCDCDAGDPTVFPGAPERNDGQDNQCPGDAGYGFVDELSATLGFPTPDKTQLCWEVQAGAALYEIVRSGAPDFSTGCSSSATSTTCTVDLSDPAPGSAAYFLARPLTPFPGSWGPGANGAERTIVCP